MSYVPLWCKSSFSFLEGASHAEEYLEAAVAHRLEAIALTDRDGVYGMVRAHVKARELGARLVCGAQITVAAPGARLASSPVSLHGADDVRRGPGWAAELPARDDLRRSERRRVPEPREPQLETPAASSQLVLLATDRAGWANLCRLITAGRRRCDKGDSLVGWDEICAHAGGLVALWGGDASLLGDVAEPPARLVGELRDAFGDRLYALLARHRCAEDAPREERLLARADAARLPVVAATEVLYHARPRRRLQDVMACIRHGVTLATAGRRIHGNDEHVLHAPHDMARLYADIPGALARTCEIAARCRFSLAELRYRYPSERLPDGSTSADYLRDLASRGAAWRARGEPAAAMRAQLAVELALIEELDYPGYFLTMYEIVQFCGRRGILCQGRGSAANSAVCYCLGITSQDPLTHHGLFERFLSRERAEPPDIDLDIEHDRREEVIQHVYEVYGRDHAAMVCNVVRYRGRSALRDVGKVLGFSEPALDRVAKQQSMYGTIEADALVRGGLAENGAQAAALGHLSHLAEEILEHPRHLSVHPGGFLLGHEPVHDIVPIENATMPGRTVIQWDKDDIEDLGLFKVDLLGLGALHQLHLAFDLLRASRGVELTMATVPLEDAGTYDMICTADTIGTFQIESRAQMSMLPRLRPRVFYDLVIQVSIVRPGPISGGMVHPYLRRRAGLEEVVYPHACLQPVLERTLGVPLFQEQVMKLAVVAADYTPGEADQLRRDMAAWRRTGRIEKHRDRLISRMEQKGIAREFGERVFAQIRGFGEYGFPESHATSFAFIAYLTSYLRRYYHPEFACALLNAYPMGFYSPATIVHDAQMHGVEVRPVDVVESAWDCTIERVASDTFAVRMGLRWVRGIRRAEADRIVAARAARAFASLEDLVRRTRPSTSTLDALAQAGALGPLSASRRDALWQVAGWVRRADDAMTELGDRSGDDVTFATLGELDHILWDYRTTSHSTLGHPLGPLRDELRARGWPEAARVKELRDGARVDYAGIVICRQQPGTAGGVTFMTLEDETGFVNLVIWAQVFATYGAIARTASLLGVSGRLQIQEGVVHVIADALWIPSLSRPIAEVASRDFH